MKIREAGILINKVPIVFFNYPGAKTGKFTLTFPSKLMRGLLIFDQYLMKSIEFFENNNYTIIFKNGNIHDYYGKVQEVTAFLVMDKDKKLEKYLYKKVIPLLERLLNEFILRYNGFKITEVAQFEQFKKKINDQ